MTANIVCPLCASTELAHVFRGQAVPRYNLQIHHTQRDALAAPLEELDFYSCRRCTFTFNAAFDPNRMDYSIEYEASRAHSRYFSEYIDQVCRDVAQTLLIADKTMVEVGCGNGQFILRLRELHKFRGYGFDTSLGTDEIPHSHEDLRFIRGCYSPDRLDVPADIILLRHVLEHQKDPHVFLEGLLGAANPPTSIYIEVPAWEWIVDNFQVQAFSYEHCSYYSRPALERALEVHGFEPEKVLFGFGGEYIQYYGSNDYSVERRPPILDRQVLIAKTESFARVAPRIIEELKGRLRPLLPDAILLGAGGKGTTLLNLLDLTHEQLKYVADSNPKRRATYIPGTGQQVVDLDFLRKLKPRYVLVTNSNYAPEITSQLAALGLHPEIVALDRWFNTLSAAIAG